MQLLLLHCSYNVACKLMHDNNNNVITLKNEACSCTCPLEYLPIGARLTYTQTPRYGFFVSIEALILANFRRAAQVCGEIAKCNDITLQLHKSAIS